MNFTDASLFRTFGAVPLTLLTGSLSTIWEKVTHFRFSFAFRRILTFAADLRPAQPLFLWNSSVR